MNTLLPAGFTEWWKRRFIISASFAPPLLIRNKNRGKPLGPLIFTPDPNSSVTLLQSPQLAPRLPPPYPNFSVPRFLQINDVASSAASGLGSEVPDYSSYFHGFNSLQMLQIPDKNLIVVFFPTGENSDHVGFSLLSIKDGKLSVRSQRDNFFQVAKEGNAHRQRITRLLINPVDNFCSNENADDIAGDARNVNKRSNFIAVVGFLMVCTDYSVSWYRVGINTLCKQNEFSVCLDYLGCADSKTFKGNAVASACWSPHRRGECLVLLKNGDFLLFDVNDSCGKKGKSTSSYRGNTRVVKKKMYVSLNDKLGLEEKNGDEEWGWFGCEFSLFPGKVFVSHRNEVFSVDMMSPGDCKVSSLLKLEMLSVGKNDCFLALSRVSSDESYFTVATRKWLLLCGICEPSMPLLYWKHGLHNPHYTTVFRLSELRANCNDTKYKWASESGRCILLGSFWDSKFNLFCYGPDNKEDGSVCSEITKYCNSHYAWGLPSSLPFSDSDCNYGSCPVREEFSRASLPVWIDWRQKKQLTLGFGILDPAFSSQLLPAEDSFSGFMLIKLTSSGKLVAESYTAAWESKKVSEAGHKRKSIYLEDNLLYDRNNLDYDGEKKFQHMKLEFLNAYLEDRLPKYMVKRREKRKERDKDAHKDNLVKSESNFHQEICNKLKAFGFPRVRSSFGVPDVLKGISWPTSIHEIALMSISAELPANLLQLAFSTYSDFDEDLEKHKEAPLEFLDIPDQLQTPPFPFRKPSNRSNKWSRKVRPPSTLVGPIHPPQFLTILHKLRMEECKAERELYPEESERFSAHSQFKLQCDKVMEVVKDHVSGSDTKTEEDEFVNLGDDAEETSYGTEKVKLCYHQPSAFLEIPSSVGLANPGCDDDIFSTFVFRKNEELSDVGCPIEFKFADCAIDFGQKGLEPYQKLLLDFQKSFKPYQDCIKKMS